MAAAEDRLDGAIAYRALVRYDAYNEMSGHQSTTIALLDADHNGVVLSSIAHRDTARLYCKQVHAGRGEHQLSPEEEEAVRLALAGEVGSVILSEQLQLRVAYLGPPGHRQRRGADGRRAGARGACRWRRCATSCSRCRRAGSSGRWRRSRTRSRAAWTRCSTRSRSRRTTSR